MYNQATQFFLSIFWKKMIHKSQLGTWDAGNTGSGRFYSYSLVWCDISSGILYIAIVYISVLYLGDLPQAEILASVFFLDSFVWEKHNQKLDLLYSSMSSTISSSVLLRIYLHFILW